MERPDSPSNPITVVIAVGVRLYRDGLATALAAKSHVRIGAAAGTAIEIQLAARDLQPDVIILDVALDNVRALMGTLRNESARSRIMAFAVREDIATILDYAEAGAEGFFTANGSIADLVEAIERMAAGELLCSPAIAAQLLRRAAHQQASDQTGHAVHPILTSRQQQVLSLLKEGRSNKEIAIALNIAEATAKNHVHQVLQKLHVDNRARAIAVGAPDHSIYTASRTA